MIRKLQLLATAALCIASFAMQAQTSFIGEGKYRIKNFGNPTNYMAYGTPTSSSNDILLSTDNTSSETIFNIVENANNPGKYNIYSSDDVRFINVVSGTSVLGRKPSDNNSIDDEIAVFEILHQSVVSDTYSIGISYQGTPKYLKDNGAMNITTATGFGSAVNKWVFEYVGNLSVNGVQKSTNAVYPVPSTDGIFYLKESAAWSVNSITGASIANGNGTKIDLSNAPKGVYILRFNGVSRKIIF